MENPCKDYSIDIDVYPRFTHPMEQPYIQAIKNAYPDWILQYGPYCPGKAGCLTYGIFKDNVNLLVSVRDETYLIDSAEEFIKCDDGIWRCKSNIQNSVT